MYVCTYVMFCSPKGAITHQSWYLLLKQNAFLSMARKFGRFGSTPAFIHQIGTGRYKRDHIYWGLPELLDCKRTTWNDVSSRTSVLMFSWANMFVADVGKKTCGDSVEKQRVPIPSHIIHREAVSQEVSDKATVIFSISMNRNTPICTSGSRKGHGSISLDSWETILIEPSYQPSHPLSGRYDFEVHFENDARHWRMCVRCFNVLYRWDLLEGLKHHLKCSER